MNNIVEFNDLGNVY